MLACITILDLPDEIIERILLVTAAIASPATKVKDVARFIVTCKYLYNNYLYLLYCIRPITIENMFSTFKSKGKLDLLNWAYVCSHPLSVTDRIAVLNVVSTTPVLPWYYSSKVDYLRGGPPSLTTFNLEIGSNLHKFGRLTSLNVSSDNADILQFLIHCRALKHFKWLITYSESSFNRDHSELQAKITGFVPAYQLETFIISSDKPIVQSLIPKLLMVRRFNLERVFVAFQVRADERKNGMVQFGAILYQLLDMFRASLLLIELHKLDGALIFNKLHPTITFNYSFPSLRLLLFDNSSLVRLSSWIKLFQKNNLGLRNQMPCIIAINDSISGKLLTTTPLPPTVFPDNWCRINTPAEQVDKLKQHLKLKQ